MANILVILALLVIARAIVVYGIQYLTVNTLKSHKTIYEINFRPGQVEREKMQPFYGSLIDAAFLLVLYLTGILVFVQDNFSQYLLLLGLHVFVTEPLYYGYHRLLHIRGLYKKHHIYHHWSVIAMPTTSFTFTFSERFSYTLLFGIPVVIASLCGVLSVTGLFVYLIVFDAINALGHLNHEVFPRWYGKSRLRYLLYTPTFHSQHHSKFQANYALFMPVYDKIFGTYAEETDEIFDEVSANHPISRVHRSPTH